MRLLPIARPCAASFAAMHGDRKTRFCDACGKHVHDLSARSEDEARALLAAARGTRICVRYAKDASGAVRFGAATLAAAVSLAACAPHQATRTAAAPVGVADAGVEGDYDMGDMIPDVEDRCPDEPNGSGSIDDNDGCERDGG